MSGQREIGPETPETDAASEPAASTLGIREASERLGVSVQTLRRWDKSGALRAERHPVNNYRVYRPEQLEAYLISQGAPPDTKADKGTGSASVYASPNGGGLVGRQDALGELDRLRHAGEALVFLVGAAGVGKTRVLSAWTAKLENAVVVSVGLCRERDELTDAIFAALGLNARARSPEGREAELKGAIRKLEGTVLALDEVENLGDDAHRLIAQLAGLGPFIVATSRVRPPLLDARVLKLAPLAFPSGDETRPETASRQSPAAQLFVAQAERHGGLSVVDDEVWRHAGTIARLLGGLPLALTLAASRTLEIGVARLASELEHSFEVVNEGSADTPPQHQTLRGAITSSLDRLEPQSASLLEVSLLLAEGFSFEELEGLAAECGVTTRGLRDLIDHSIVSSRQREGASSSLCFGIHTLVRQIASERTSPSRREELTAGHARWRARQAEALADDHRPQAIPVIAAAEAGFRAAFEWTEEHAEEPDAGAMGATIASALGRLIESRGPSPWLTSLLDRAVSRAAEAGVPLARRAELAFYRGFARVETWDLQGARKELEEARVLAAAGANPRIEGRAWAQLAWCAARDGRVIDADEMREGLAKLTSTAGDPRLEMLVTGLHAVLELNGANFSRARKGVERWRERAVAARDETHEAFALGSVGCVAFEEEGPEASIVHFDRAIAFAERRHLLMAVGIFSGYRAMAYHALRDPRAEEAYLDAIARAERAHSLVFAALFRGWHAALRAEQGHAEEATRVLDLMSAFTQWDVSETMLSLFRGHVDLHHARMSDDPKSEAQWLGRATRRLLPVDGAQVKELRELRLINAYLDRAIAAALPTRRVAEGLSVGWRGCFVARDGEEVSLARHRTLPRVLWSLALRQLTEPGTPVSGATLIAETWPNERMDESAGIHRLRVALSTLRKSGLGESLLHEARGYLIDPELLLVLAR